LTEFHALHARFEKRETKITVFVVGSMSLLIGVDFGGQPEHVPSIIENRL